MSQLPTKNSSINQTPSLANAGLVVAATIMVLGAGWLLGAKFAPAPAATTPAVTVPQPTETPLPEPSAIPSPTLVPPKPTKAAATSQTNSTGGEQKNCATLKNGGFSDITIKLEPRSGQMTGDTVVRLKQGGNCPGNSTSEQWLSAGERQKTFSHVSTGTYLVEIANGNYQGVIRKVVTVEGGREYVFTVPVND